MDGTQFDQVVKSFAQGQSRRRLLRGMVAAAVALAVKPSGKSDAATCYMAGEYCNFDVECCVGTCTYGICRCPAGKTNCNGYCRDTCDGCPVGWRKCNGVCRDPKTDRNNCGYCGNVCPKGTNCSGGQCCRIGEIFCDGQCKPQSQCV